MKLPQRPTPFLKLMSGNSAADWMKLSLEALRQGPTVDGRYLHWDELRRRPASEGASTSAWWQRLKLSRMRNHVPLPLVDTKGVPFWFSNYSALQRQLYLIDSKSSGRIETLPGGVTRETSKRYVMSSLIEEAISSSLLEGAATTRTEAKQLLTHTRGPRTHGERMVANNYLTMQALAEWKDEPLTTDLLLRIHAAITRDTLSDPDQEGRIARSGETRDVCDMENNLVHSPPPPEELPKRLVAMIAFANEPDVGSDPEAFLHPVLRSVLLHFWLAYDHPFLDGNGRTARALFYWSMLRRGYWFFEFVSISELLLRAPMPYYRAFQYSEADEGDCTYFVTHQLDVLVRALEAAEEHITARQKDLAEWGAVRTLGLNHRQQQVLRFFLADPGAELDFAAHKSEYGVTYQTARTDLLGLESLDLVDRTKVGNRMVFTAKRDLEERLSAADEE